MAYGNVNVGAGEKLDTSGFLTKSQLGAAGGVATLGEDGKLTSAQRPVIDCYTQAQTNSAISSGVSSHNSSTSAHPDMRNSISAMLARLEKLELQFSTEVTKNAFTVDFDTVDEVTYTGSWNETLARIEF